MTTKTANHVYEYLPKDLVDLCMSYVDQKNPCEWGFYEGAMTVKNVNRGIANACKNGHIDIVKLMISKGADDWDLGLVYACEGGSVIIVKLMIEIKNIEKSFEGTSIIKGVSTTFEKGKTNLIIGQSGSGKTVLLKCLLGLHEPDSGEIIYDGISNKNMKESDRTLLRRQMGMVFQGSALFDSMSVIENVMFPLNMLTEQSDDEIIEKAKKAIERVELSKAVDKLPSEISGGMQKRVAIARAIVMNPKYLFCDEPNSGLDPKTAIVIDQLIQEITKEYNITTIINSHDMNSVIEIGEKIIFLVSGEKNWEGTNKEILKTDNKSVTNFVYSSELLKKVRKHL